MYFDAIIIGGGPAGVAVATSLSESGLDCALIMSGRSLSDVSLMKYRGTFISSDIVLSGKFDGQRLLSVSTRNLGPDALKAGVFVLATGKFAACGLRADSGRVYEPVLGLDVEYDADRGRWFSSDFFAPQPFLQFGVLTDEQGRAYRNGQILENVFAAGEVLSGVSVAVNPDEIEKSALRVVKTIKG